MEINIDTLRHNPNKYEILQKRREWLAYIRKRERKEQKNEQIKVYNKLARLKKKIKRFETKHGEIIDNQQRSDDTESIQQ
jgi:hypothetical protein